MKCKWQSYFNYGEFCKKPGLPSHCVLRLDDEDCPDYEPEIEESDRSDQ